MEAKTLVLEFQRDSAHIGEDLLRFPLQHFETRVKPVTVGRMTLWDDFEASEDVATVEKVPCPGPGYRPIRQYWGRRPGPKKPLPPPDDPAVPVMDGSKLFATGISVSSIDATWPNIDS